MSKPLQIGITGGIGAGKSTICQIFQTLGVPIYNADDRAKWLMNNSSELKKLIIDAFSVKAYNDSGLDRAYLAEHVFHNPEELKKLNALVHPAVAKDYADWVREHSQHPYVIKEAALLFEAGSYQELDKIIVVVANDAERINRVLARDPHRDEAQVKAIINKQMSVEEAIERADFVIENDGSEMVLPKVLELHERFSLNL